jgi:peroxiredoxin (alkyl hydroperoxide reductase subunit C)
MAVLVTKQAPDFTAPTVMADNSVQQLNLKSFLRGKMGVLFFYPLDFTFVCPSEILAFNKRLPEFHARNVEVLAVSVDSQFSHIAYKNTKLEDGGIGSVQFPMVSDISKDIAKNYDVLFNDAVALRATFLIDENFVIRHQIVNDLPIGRSIEETLRTIDALQHHQLHGDVCPANWNKGSEAMKPTQEGVANYLKNHANNF